MIGKKWFSLGLICSLFLTGCGSNKQDGMFEEEKEYEKVSLFCDVDFWKPSEWTLEEGTVTGDISRKTGAMIDVIDVTGDADRQLSLKIINNDLPDLISVTDSTVISQLVSSGKVWKLDEFLERYKPDSHILKDFPEDIKKNLLSRDGAWYAYPSHMSSQDNRNVWVPSDEYYVNMVEYGYNNSIIWNKKLLKELNIDISGLQNKEQILEAFEIAKNTKKTIDGKEIIPFLMDGTDYQESTLEFFTRTFGVENIDEQGNYVDSMLQPQMKEALDFFNTIIRKGYAEPEQITMSNERINELLSEGRVLCFVGNNANIMVDFRDWKSSAVILSENGNLPVFGRNSRGNLGWINTFVSKDCSHPEETANLLDYMTSGEGQMRWVLGTEGIHYQMNKQGLVELTEEGLEAQKNGSQSGVNVWWMFVNSDWDRSVKAPVPEGGQEEAREIEREQYALDEHTSVYDASLLQNLSAIYAGDDQYESIEAQIETWKKSQVKKVILAESELAFEEEYSVLIKGLEDRQIHLLDQMKNEGYKEKCRIFGAVIKPVNVKRESSDE